MIICSQKSASIQKRTSPLKFDHFRYPKSDFTASDLSTKVPRHGADAGRRALLLQFGQQPAQGRGPRRRLRVRSPCVRSYEVRANLVLISRTLFCGCCASIFNYYLNVFCIRIQFSFPGSFSAGSTPILKAKYAFFRIS